MHSWWPQFHIWHPWNLPLLSIHLQYRLRLLQLLMLLLKPFNHDLVLIPPKHFMLAIYALTEDIVGSRASFRQPFNINLKMFWSSPFFDKVSTLVKLGSYRFVIKILGDLKRGLLVVLLRVAFLQSLILLGSSVLARGDCLV